MYPSPDTDVRHRVAVLFSRASRDAYAAEATERGETYTFTDAWGASKTWLKGEYAYLSPNAASALLNRCNLKHDWADESELTRERIDGYRALLVPNAGHLAPDAVSLIGDWLERTDGRLLVGGKTNLPDALLGIAARTPVPVEGFTGWRWLPGSPFGDLRAWEELYLSGYRGHLTYRVEPTRQARVLAELVEFGGDLSSAATASKRPIGPAIVVTERTAYISNQVFELLGGVMQAHLNVEGIRKWANPTHWGDTLMLMLRRLLLEIGLGPLWDTRLRTFGAHNGVLSFRHDVHGMRDYSMLDYQIQNLIPGSYDIEDPAASIDIQPSEMREWVDRTSQNNFIEPALHNDSAEGDPPRYVYGKGLYEHVRDASESFGVPIYTCGRHAGGHMHPETLDAMDYLYAHDDTILGLCTFCFYHMIEYGVRRPDVQARGRSLTYVTDPRPTIATPGFWFPYHPVVTTDTEWRVLRGWDRTHEYDCSYDLVDTLFGGHCSRLGGPDDQLENGVYALQYHPEYANDPSRNDGQGTLGSFRYAINLAERKNFWIANQRQLYQRMADYQDLACRIEDDGSVILHNPTGRRIDGLVLEQRRAFGSVWDGDHELIHVAKGRFVTLPPLQPGERKTIRFSAERTSAPRIVQESQKGIVVLDARHDPATGTSTLLLNVCRRQNLRVERVDPEGSYIVQVQGQPEQEISPRVVVGMQTRLGARPPGEENNPYYGALIFLQIDVDGDSDNFEERSVTIRPGAGARAIKRQERA